jgi:hypothetical protein
MKKAPKDAIPVGERKDQQEIKNEGTFCDARKDEIMRRDAARIQRKAANAHTRSGLALLRQQTKDEAV